MKYGEFIALFILILVTGTMLLYAVENNNKTYVYENTEIYNSNKTVQEVVRCSFNTTIQYYHQNVFPSKQCEGVDVDDMKVYINPYSTGSMRPYIFKNDFLYIVEYDPDKDLVLGDVISNGKHLHRIIAINEKEGHYYTKGDNVAKRDLLATDFEDTEYIVCGVFRGAEE